MTRNGCIPHPPTQAYNKGKTDHAMNSLKAAMKWDEERFGLEYDLDLFNIVAVDDFNMGTGTRGVPDA